MAKHHVLTLDFESYYDDVYSLRKMTPAEYILDPRFETIMMSAIVDNNEPQLIDAPDIGAFLTKYPPELTTTICFNALFDNCILAWHYGYVPARMLDAMGMARALLGHELHSFSLESVAEHLGVGHKGREIFLMKGKHRADILRGGRWGQACSYAMLDAVLCKGVFATLLPQFPASEQRVMDLVLRTAVIPIFRANEKLLSEHLEDVEAEKAALLVECGLTSPDMLMSTPQFQEALERLGVEIEYKESPTGNRIPAFAKTDQFMEDLLDDEDPQVQALAAARLGHKSTLEETRTSKFMRVAALNWGRGGTMPMPLRYGGAHTHRLSGDWKMNVQNMPTARGSKGKSKLRTALKPPPDHVVVSADLGQIEARLGAWFCGAKILLHQFAEKKDPYAVLATSIFGFQVDRKVHKIEGFIGKTGVLGLGYGCGADKFYSMVIKLARLLGMDLGDKFSKDMAVKAVHTYRGLHFQIPAMWNKLNAILGLSWLGLAGPVKVGPVVISKGAVELPSGLFLRYADPVCEWVPAAVATYGATGRNEFRYRRGKKWYKIYGAKWLENIIQALARIVVMNAALRINDRGYRMVLQAHDELVFIIHRSEVDKACEIIHTEMTRSPSWARDLPLTADVKVGPSYGELEPWKG